MPTEFLTDAQELPYGHYSGPPSNQQLEGYFYLDDAHLELVKVRRGAQNKLGFALQLTTARFLRTFLTEPTDAPPNVVAYVAAQLGIRDVACLAEYGARSNTAWEHAAEIRQVYGYRELSDPGVSFPLVRWLYTRAWLSAEQPSVLFDLATAWLVERQVSLPGVSVLARLITRIRERANARLYRRLAGLPSAEQRDRLRQLLVVPAGSRRSPRGDSGMRVNSVSMISTCRLSPRVGSKCWRGMQAPPVHRGSNACLLSAGWRRWSPSPARWKPTRRMMRSMCWTGCSPTCWHGWTSRSGSGGYARSVIWTPPPCSCAISVWSYLTGPRLITLCATRSWRVCHVSGSSKLSRRLGALARLAENAQAPETLLIRYSIVRQFLPLLLATIAPHATTGGKAVRGGSSCIVSSAPHRHRCTRRRCGSSRQPGGGWWCVQTKPSIGVRTPSVRSRRRMRPMRTTSSGSRRSCTTISTSTDATASLCRSP